METNKEKAGLTKVDKGWTGNMDQWNDASEGKIEELNEQVTFPKTKEGYNSRKAIDDEIKRLENVVEQTRKSYDNNKPEVYRMEVNFQVFDEKVNELRA